jgi:hypothetical protein
LSEIENEHVEPTPSEMERLERALTELLHAQEALKEAAASVGWPVGRV